MRRERGRVTWIVPVLFLRLLGNTSFHKNRMTMEFLSYDVMRLLSSLTTTAASNANEVEENSIKDDEDDAKQQKEVQKAVGD